MLPGGSSIRLPLTTRLTTPTPLTVGVTPETIRAIITDFYAACRGDPLLGPIFNHHVHDWDAHLNRIQAFWCAAILGLPGYSGRPLEAHRTIPNLASGHFAIWLRLFAESVRAHCSPRDAEVIMELAGRMARHMRSVIDPREPAA